MPIKRELAVFLVFLFLLPQVATVNLFEVVSPDETVRSVSIECWNCTASEIFDLTGDKIIVRIPYNETHDQIILATKDSLTAKLSPASSLDPFRLNKYNFSLIKNKSLGILPGDLTFSSRKWQASITAYNAMFTTK
ncbi:hypothetical protein E3E33_05240 [Thermococcus sp. GR5]|nr:hypothetical protein [Thermococcus sp. GR4]NJF22999.1 hypothetical protein [Thermococcus sp. GR5]